MMEKEPTQLQAPLPNQMAAVLLNAGEDFTFDIQSLDRPLVGPEDVLVELEVTGICGTDIALATGHLGKTNPIIGHEGVGRVIAVGSGCSKAVVGQRVAVGWLRDACGSCRPCMLGEETRCKTQVFSGRDVPGTLARLTVVPERYIINLPDSLPAEHLAPIVCAGVTAYKALKCSEAVQGSWVAIFGAAGGVGALAIQYAKAMGYRALAIDRGETPRKICLDLGAEAYLDYEKEHNLGAAVSLLTDNRLCSAAIICAGSVNAYESAIPCLDYFGVLVGVGIPPPTTNVSFHPLSLIDRGIKMIGSMVGSRADTEEAVEFVRRGLVTPKVVSVGIDELNAAMRRMTGLEGKLIVQLKSLG